MATQNMQRVTHALTWSPLGGSTEVRLACGHDTTAMHYDPTVEQWLTCIVCDNETQYVRFGVWDRERQEYDGGSYEIEAR